ncbi:MAG TPA: C4-dicarboxylate ABC transporter [Syntrophomonadaceae bacterium]|nr:C4-dicarboxylate ABC transporter [Syntrophomonadaceae bacterium]
MNEKIRKIGIFAMAVIFIGSLFIKQQWLNDIDQLLLVIVLLLSLLNVKGTSRVIGWILFLAGAAIFIIYRAGAGMWLEGISRNLYLVVMFSLVPLLGLPIRNGGYMKELQAFFKHHVRKDKQFYIFVNLITFAVSTMVNIAAIPLMYQICQASDKSKNVKLLATAIVRGFSACIIWAPSYAAVALIMELTGAQWMHFFPYALIAGILALLPGWFMIASKNTDAVDGFSPENQAEVETYSQPNWAKIIELGFFCLLLIVGIVVVSNKTGITTVSVVSIFSLCFPLAWMAIIKKLPEMLQAVKEQYYGQSLGKLSNEVVLFIGAGFFATAVGFSHLGDLVPQMLTYLVHNNALGFSCVVISLAIILGILGVHPIITVTVIGSTVHPQAFNLTPTMMAITLSASWALATAASPSSATNIAMAGLINRSVDIGPRWNTVYAFTAMVLVVLAMGCFRFWGLL